MRSAAFDSGATAGLQTPPHSAPPAPAPPSTPSRAGVPAATGSGAGGKPQAEPHTGAGAGAKPGASTHSGKVVAKTHTPGHAYTRPKTRVRTVVVTRYRTHTVTKYRTHTVTVEPKLPAGAVLPSRHAALTLTHFSVPGRTVSCVMSGGSVRCDAANPSWSPPPQPPTCTETWGMGVVLTDSRPATSAQFTCGGSPVSSAAGVVRVGQDDTVGPITCEVRDFGVDCFARDRRGFILGSTGYFIY